MKTRRVLTFCAYCLQLVKLALFILLVFPVLFSSSSLLRYSCFLFLLPISYKALRSKRMLFPLPLPKHHSIRIYFLFLQLCLHIYYHFRFFFLSLCPIFIRRLFLFSFPYFVSCFTLFLGINSIPCRHLALRSSYSPPSGDRTFFLHDLLFFSFFYLFFRFLSFIIPEGA